MEEGAGDGGGGAVSAGDDIRDAKKALEAKWVCFTDAVGKTIAKATNKYEDIYVAYTDGTFTAIGATGDDDDAYIDDRRNAYAFDTDALHEIGLIHDDIYQPWKREADEISRKMHESNDRATLARLKAKYEGGQK